MNTQFNINPSYLSTRLFTPDRPRIGAHTYLNVNLLPDFVQYIKRNLTQQELIALSEYQLQTYIMELSIKEKVTESLNSFVSKILAHVRTHKQFWINGIIVGSKENQEKQKQEQKHQHQAIIQYQKDIQHIQSKIPNYPEKIFNNKKKRRIQPFMSILKTDFIDRTKEVMKINFTNFSMMPAYVLKDYFKQEGITMNLPKHKNLSKDQIGLLNILQNAVQYFLMQQKPRTLKAQQIKRRQVFRQRRLPAHLISNIAQPTQQEQKVDEQASLYSKQSHEIEPLNFHEHHLKHNSNKTENNLQNKNQKIEEESSQSSESSFEEEENKFYLNFHGVISKKQFYDSKMFSKQPSINQSHNMMQILRCLIYFHDKKQDIWFDRKWKELQLERIEKEQKRKQEQQEESDKSSQNDSKRDLMNKSNEKIDQQVEKIVDQNEKEWNKSGENIKNQEKIEQNNDPIRQQKQINQNKPDSQKLSNQIIDQSEESNEKIIEKQEKLQQIQIGIRKPIFDEQWKNPQTFSYKRLTKHLSDRFLTMREIYFVTKQFVNRQIMKEFNMQKEICIQKQRKSQKIQDGLDDPQGTNLDEILLEFKQMIQHPQNVKLSAFKTQGIKIPWDDTDYLMFLRGLKEFFFIPTNNRKIAQFMMSKNTKKVIEANHVKYVKAIYLKNMQVRIDRGESGGGKKGKMSGKTEFIDKDIESFSMRWFDKMKKSKKRQRRRRFDDDEDGALQEADSAY